MRVTATCWRWKQLYEKKFESVEQALDYLEKGEDAGILSSQSISVDGKVVLEGNALLRAASERLNERERR